MKVVTICGSMRFYEEMQKIARRLEVRYGICAIAPTGGSDGHADSAEEIRMLTKAHHKKIDISDAIYVANIGGYIGDGVLSEMSYAKAHGKEIIFHEPIDNTDAKGGGRLDA